MPRLAIALFILLLVALAGTIAYAGYLVISVIADALDIGHFAAGLLLGVLFARLPSIRQGKLRTIGLLPKTARLPVMIVLLGLSLLKFLYEGAMVPVLFLGLAASFLLASRWMKKTIVARVISTLGSTRGSAPPRRNVDDTIIDAEFREMKDEQLK